MDTPRKVLHSADLHFSNKADKLAETIAVTDFMILQAGQSPPDVAVLAGDLVDEHDGAIRIDSDAARAAISFVTRLANICPVVIVRGTRSHDRESPYIFQLLKTRFPVYVGTQMEMVALHAFPDANTRWEFEPFDIIREETFGWTGCSAVFTLIPSPDKSNLIANLGGDSKLGTTLIAKECLHDAMAYLGELNAQVPDGVPRILVAHGMITGAEYSSGTIAVGEDFEFSLSDLALTNTDLKCFGHVHKQQSFPGNIHYSGSPGRLNFGEKEAKGFLAHTIVGRKVVTEFHPTPARYFVFSEYDWRVGINDVTEKFGFDLELKECLQEISEHPGCDVRFRLTIPEEERHIPPTRQELEQALIAAGARSAKVEYSVVPQFRQRAAGISRKETLVDKAQMWAASAGVELSPRTLALAGCIEGMDVDELISIAKQACGEEEPKPGKAFTATNVVLYLDGNPVGVQSPPEEPTQKAAAHEEPEQQNTLF
jgi:DNA repair exonuclease SbcCD nuclease subunit